MSQGGGNRGGGGGGGGGGRGGRGGRGRGQGQGHGQGQGQGQGRGGNRDGGQGRGGYRDGGQGRGGNRDGGQGRGGNRGGEQGRDGYRDGGQGRGGNRGGEQGRDGYRDGGQGRGGYRDGGQGRGGYRDGGQGRGRGRGDSSTCSQESYSQRSSQSEQSLPQQRQPSQSQQMQQPHSQQKQAWQAPQSQQMPPPQSGQMQQPPQSGQMQQPPQSGQMQQPPQSGQMQQPPQSGQMQQPPQPQQKQAPQSQQMHPPQSHQKPPPQSEQKQPSQSEPRQSAPQKNFPAAKSSMKQATSSTSISEIKPYIGKAKSTIPSELNAELYKLIPFRPKPDSGGSEGRKIEVETNMLSIKFTGNFSESAVHYDVTFSPDKPKYMFKLAVEAIRKKNFPNRYPAFDGKKNLYSARDLFRTDTFCDESEVYNPERHTNMLIKVMFKKVSYIDLSWLKTMNNRSNVGSVREQSMQALDIILGHGPSMRLVKAGRSYFSPPDGHVLSLANGLDLWVGTFQSAVLGWKPFLNLDVAHKGFPTSKNVIDVMEEIVADPRRGRGDVWRDIDKIERFLSSLKVDYQVPGNPSSRRTYRINGVGDGPATLQFTKADNTKMTVKDYYATDRNYQIKNLNYPCLWVGPKNRDKPIYIPPELCTLIPGQIFNKKMNENQTATMVKFAAVSAPERKRKILKGFEALKLNDDNCLKQEFGLSINGTFERIPARVLDPPGLQYNSGRNVDVKRGVWRSTTFLNPAPLGDNCWTILNLHDRTSERDLYVLAEKLEAGARLVGVQMGTPLKPFQAMNVLSKNTIPVVNYLQDRKKDGLKLIVVVIPDRVEAYSKIKQISELQVGILTQCIKCNTIRKLSEATIGNILLKINSKLNGVNHMISPDYTPQCLRSPCIIFGADVTHPAPEAKNTPSIAAVVASHDPKAFKYNAIIRLQPSTKEIIQELEEIVKTQLMIFYQKTKYKPSRIVFYRDGVGDGALTAVMHFEIEAIRKACRRLNEDYEPKITFLVVQKRHHIRLFPTNPRNSDDKNGNVQAGTVVDTHITHPNHMDFYLVSHASIQGTARPTKYKCLWNDTNANEDEIEKLTFYLCHMFARCTRSVSYPTPTYYAHLAAFRARALIHNIPIRMERLSDEQTDKLSLVEMNAPMFFV